MKLITYIFLFISIISMSSCNNEDFTPNVKGFHKIEQDLKNEFGVNSYYTDFSVKSNPENEHVISVTVTKDPSSLQMKGFHNTNGDWEQISEVNLELTKGKIEDYMFTLNEMVSITKIGTLVEKSIKRLTKINKLKNITFYEASIEAPSNGEKSEMLYHIQLKSQEDVYYNFRYNMKGDFCSLD